MSEIVIIANGEKICKERVLSYFSRADKIICADGGADYLRQMGIVPSVIIGDNDSILPETISFFDGKTQFINYPSAKDQTDLELALDLALSEKPDTIFILNAFGSRPDHSLAAVFLLLKAIDTTAKAFLIGPNWQMFLLKDDRAVLEGKSGDIVSLLAVSEKVEQVSTEGLRYPLKKEILYRNSSRGISNEMLSNKAVVEAESGILLVIAPIFT